MYPLSHLLLLSTVVLLTACSTVPSSSVSWLASPTAIAQRDKQSPVDPPDNAGFKATEARQLLEFCIELNNQDDRLKSDDKQFKAQVSDWHIIYDSRHPGNTRWNQQWPDTQANNPEINGFGPFNNAWLLVQSATDPTQYALVIRGTVAETRSIMADALVTTIAAQSGIKLRDQRVLPIVFAATPKAELHLGFAYAAFTLLFEQEHGILKQLQQTHLPANAKLLITGHSQGAAIATLVHSFLYYALTDNQDRYELKLRLKQGQSSGVQLKSYLFAQPKPGNLQYAQDFARIAKDTAYAINNDLDPVPQVPLSLQVPSEVVKGVADENQDKGSWWDRFKFDGLQKITDFNQNIRSMVAQRGMSHVAKRFDETKVNLDLHYFASEQNTASPQATSLNYTLAGELIPVFGVEQGGRLYPPTTNAPDVLLQHHATSYRQLMRVQFKTGE